MKVDVLFFSFVLQIVISSCDISIHKIHVLNTLNQIQNWDIHESKNESSSQCFDQWNTYLGIISSGSFFPNNMWALKSRLFLIKYLESNFENYLTTQCLTPVVKYLMEPLLAMELHWEIFMNVQILRPRISHSMGNILEI